MDRAEKMDCRANGEVILTGATTEFQLKKGLTPKNLIRMVCKHGGIAHGCD
jgi:hypothetical protein